MERVNPRVEIEIDRKRTLYYNFKTMGEIKETMGLDVLNLDEEWTPSDLREISDLIYYGLRHEDPELTRESVEEMLDIPNVEYYSEKLSQALGYRDLEEGPLAGSSPPGPRPDTT